MATFTAIKNRGGGRGALGGVRSVERVSCEGSYFEEGRRCLCALDTDDGFPFATVRSGNHTIRVV